MNNGKIDALITHNVNPLSLQNGVEYDKGLKSWFKSCNFSLPDESSQMTLCT